MTDFGVVIEGLDTIRDFHKLGGDVRRASVQAINKVARDARAEAAREITKQLNLPKSFVSPSQGRLAVRQKANRSNPEAIITAKNRPTSLARFVVGKPRAGAGVTVSVKPGQSSFLRRAFLIKLRSGSSQTDTRFNQGLAVRLGPGERLRNKLKQIKIAKGLYLLFGPSVQQAFLDNQGDGVANDLAGPTAKKLEAEFLRLLAL
ncbi:MAG: phage tail protein [Geminicoccaceae bacterium]